MRARLFILGRKCQDTSLSTSGLGKDGCISSTTTLTIFSTGSSYIFSIVWTKLAESLVYDFPLKLIVLIPSKLTLKFQDSDPFLFIISLILSGTLCAFSVGLTEGTEGVLGSSFFSSSAVIKLHLWRSFNSLFTSAIPRYRCSKCRRSGQ